RIEVLAALPPGASARRATRQTDRVGPSIPSPHQALVSEALRPRGGRIDVHAPSPPAAAGRPPGRAEHNPGRSRPSCRHPGAPPRVTSRRSHLFEPADGVIDPAARTYLGHVAGAPTADAGVLDPVRPSDGEVLARVQASSQSDYDSIVERAQAAFAVWRTS